MNAPETEAPPGAVRGAPLSERIERLSLAFFATPTDGRSAAFLRVSLGVVAVWQAIGVGLNLGRYWGADGMVPYAVVAGERYAFVSPFRFAPESALLLGAHGVVFALAALALLVGYRPRIAAIVLAYVHVSLQLRNPFLLNSGDRLFSIQLALAAIAPLGARAGVDAWLRRRRDEAPASGTVWGQRLVSLQIAYVYLNSAFAKLANPRWREGMALRDVLASPVFAEWPRYVDARPLVLGATWGTLAFELAFPIVVWWRRPRPWLVAAGVAFHAAIDATMVIPVFSAIMIASYPAFLSDAETSALWERTVGQRGLGRLFRRVPTARETAP